MVLADNIASAARARDAYRDKNGAPNWAEWANQNRNLNDMLNAVEEMIANGE